MRTILKRYIEMLKTQSMSVMSTAWYDKKSEATFSDIIAFVRRSIWAEKYFDDSTIDAEYMKIKLPQWDALLDQLARAA